MSPGLRSLGSSLFLMGGIAVVTGIFGAWRYEGQEQASLAFALVGGLGMIAGLAADWLGVNPARQVQPAKQPVLPPPAMRLSSRPAGGKGYREDLMA